LSAKEKPTFWIDKDSVESLGLKSGAQYEKFKSKTIKIHGAKEAEGHSRLLVDVKGMSLGYDTPLFEGINFQLREGDMMELRGRNGAGKTTLIKTLLAYARDEPMPAKVFDGYIETDSKLVIGVYEQEVAPDLFDKTLSQAIESIYLSRNLSISETKVRQLMSDYLFSMGDADVPVKLLSGGQKARLQLVSMMASNPSLLVLDEPTNHLDLPSIEELESALKRYKGAILYVSHDSYFQAALGGNVTKIV
jgi:ATP-binding cassette subfamily F protein 3